MVKPAGFPFSNRPGPFLNGKLLHSDYSDFDQIWDIPPYFADPFTLSTQDVLRERLRDTAFVTVGKSTT